MAPKPINNDGGQSEAEFYHAYSTFLRSDTVEDRQAAADIMFAGNGYMFRRLAFVVYRYVKVWPIQALTIKPTGITWQIHSDEELAEDLFQEVYVKICNRILASELAGRGGKKPIESIEGYLETTAGTTWPHILEERHPFVAKALRRLNTILRLAKNIVTVEFPQTDLHHHKIHSIGVSQGLHLEVDTWTSQQEVQTNQRKKRKLAILAIWSHRPINQPLLKFANESAKSLSDRFSMTTQILESPGRLEECLIEIFTWLDEPVFIDDLRSFLQHVYRNSYGEQPLLDLETGYEEEHDAASGHIHKNVEIAASPQVHDLATRIQDKLATLDDEDRQIVDLLAKKTPQIEIAKIVGISAGSMRNRIGRIRDDVKRDL